MKKNRLRSSIFAKLMIIFLFATVVLYSIYFYFYSSSMRLLKTERLNAIYTAGKEYLQAQDRQVANVKRAIYNSYALQDWNALATKSGQIDDYKDLQQVIIAEERIRAIADTSQMVEEVSVSFPNWGRTISTENGLEDLDINEWNNIKMPSESVGAQIVYYKGNAYLTSKYQIANPELFSISAKINFDNYYNYYGNNGIEGLDISTYLLDTKTNLLLLNKPGNVDEKDTILANVSTIKYKENTYQRVIIGNIKYLLVNNSSSYSDLRIINVVKEDELTAPFTFQRQLIVIFLIVISMIILLMFIYVNHSFITPIGKMLQAFKLVEKGNFTSRLSSKTNDEFGVLFSSFNHMEENLSSLVKEVYEKELLIERANLKQLQSQINPHFLYNSFYALATMIKIGDDENAAVFCTHLATFYQYITRSGSDTVALSDELNHAENYLNIMAMRNSNIETQFLKDPKGQLATLQVPRLIIQPIIENAFEHGSKSITGRFYLSVNSVENENGIQISVEDNGNCTDEEIYLLQDKLREHQSMKETTGLINIHERLKIFFGNKSGITVSRSSFGGLKVTVNIVMKGEQEDDIQSNDR
jgi:two-component system sensor histidine kinase YesM